ncbi:MAG: BamA/TamA family outer membrane protein [Candidatus Margulisbacteria bacterium]|nr:BamA/TamA family outer membrane protein [Candidatus Margulisiibacteriota bacterium]
MFRFLFSACLVLIIFCPTYSEESKDFSISGILGQKATTTSSQSKENIITAITIEGQSQIPRSLILKEIALKVGDPLNPFIIQNAVKSVKSMGVFSNVRSEVTPLKEGKRLKIIVKENPLISLIRFEGNTIYTDEDLLSKILSKPQEILNLQNVRNDVSELQSLYSDNGYFQAKVYGVETPNKEGDPLVFKFIEGKISEIQVTGNTRTKDYVILREMDLKPGMILNKKLLKEDLRRIYNLNFFSDVYPNFYDANVLNETILEIGIAERSTGTFTFGGGFGQTSGWFGNLDLSFDNLLGTGQLVSLRGSFGRSTTYQLKYHNPWMWPKRKSFTARAWSTSGQQGFANPFSSGDSFSFRDEDRVGFDLAVGWPYSYELRTIHRIKSENISVPSIGNHNIRSYNFVISLDKRDVWFNPSEGLYYTYSVERGFPLDSESLDFTRNDLTFNHFFKIVEKQTIATRIKLGLITGIVEDTEIYYVGGAYTVRGYDDFNPFAIGNKQALFNLEYRLLFSDMFQGILFIDTGYATTGNDLFDFKKYRLGKGVGMRLLVPGLGPIRLDLGNDDQGSWRVHFSIGHIF